MQSLNDNLTSSGNTIKMQDDGHVKTCKTAAWLLPCLASSFGAMCCAGQVKLATKASPKECDFLSAWGGFGLLAELPDTAQSTARHFIVIKLFMSDIRHQE